MKTILGLTRVQGFLLDLLTGALLATAGVRVLDLSPVLILPGGAAGLLVGLRWSTTRAAQAIESSRPELKHALSAWLEGCGGALRSRL